MKQYNINILNYISTDISNENNPIRYYNLLFNRCWNNNENIIKEIVFNIFEMLDNIIKSNNRYRVKKYKWSNIKHDLPINYLHFKIKLSNFDYKSLIYSFINTDYLEMNDIIKWLNNLQNGYYVSLDIKLEIENNINRCDVYNFDYLELYFYYNENLDMIIKNNLLKNIMIITKWFYNLTKKKIIFIYFDIKLKKK